MQMRFADPICTFCRYNRLLGSDNHLHRLLTRFPFSDQFRPIGQLGKGPLDGIRLGMDVALGDGDGTVSGNARQGESIAPGLTQASQRGMTKAIRFKGRHLGVLQSLVRPLER